MGCGIYKITNELTNKVYIGSSVDICGREYKHFWMLEKGIHDNTHLQKSFNKYGRSHFVFKVIEYCSEFNLIERENYYINSYNSNNINFGYNLATVNEFRRNTYNDEVKVKLSKYNLNKNNNFNSFTMISIIDGSSHTFDNLVDAANYLIGNGFTKGKPNYVRMKISNTLRGKIVNNGSNGSIRKTCYKHKLEIIN